MHHQSEFNFEGADQGYVKWVEARKVATVELAKRLNMPLNHQVEVWLRGDIRLRGRLRLRHEQLFVEEGHERHLEFEVDAVPFNYGEMESCTRTD